MIMKLKKEIAVLTAAMVFTALVLTVSAVDYGEEYKNKPSGTYTVTFSDVPKNHWAFSYIGEMQRRGIINGYPDGKYYPDNYVERCEFAKIMVGAAGLRLSYPPESYFCDVQADDWFFGYVEAAKNYLTGYTVSSQKYYNPNSFALREDIAVALVKLKGYDTRSADLNLLKTMFLDYESISSSAKPYVATAVERGLVSGYEDGTFRGQDSINRAEAAAMLWRAYQYGNDNKITEVSDNYSEFTSGSNTDSTLTPTEESKKTEFVHSDGNITSELNDSKEKNLSSDTNKDSNSSPEVAKAYAVKTLAKAQISDSLRDFTVDDDDIVYYIDSKDNSLYKIDTDGGSAKKITSLSKLKYQETEISEETIQVKKKIEKTSVTEDEKDEKDEEIDSSDKAADKTGLNSDDDSEGTDDEDEYIYETKTVEKEIVVAEYSDFVSEQVYYDKISDKVFLTGYFTNKTNKDGQEGNGIYAFTLDADNLCKAVNNYRLSSIPIIGSLKNGQVISGHDGGYSSELHLINTDTGNKTYIRYSGGTPCAAEQIGNKLYCLDYYKNSQAGIYVYDFSSKNAEFFETEFTVIGDKLALGNNCFYFWDITSGKITTFNVKTQKFKTLDIDTVNGVELEDGWYISADSDRVMKVTSDERFVFADRNAGAIRVLYKKL